MRSMGPLPLRERHENWFMMWSTRHSSDAIMLAR